jgi:hypothetical protein
MKNMLIAAGMWTAVVAFLLMFVGWDLLHDAPTCGHAISPGPACLAQIDAFNEALRRYWHLPLYITIASGYALIVIIRIWGVLRARNSSDERAVSDG